MTSWPPKTSSSSAGRPASTNGSFSVTRPIGGARPATTAPAPATVVVATEPRAPSSQTPTRAASLCGASLTRASDGQRKAVVLSSVAMFPPGTTGRAWCSVARANDARRSFVDTQEKCVRKRQNARWKGADQTSPRGKLVRGRRADQSPSTHGRGRARGCAAGLVPARVADQRVGRDHQHAADNENRGVQHAGSPLTRPTVGGKPFRVVHPRDIPCVTNATEAARGNLRVPPYHRDDGLAALRRPRRGRRAPPARDRAEADVSPQRGRLPPGRSRRHAAPDREGALRRPVHDPARRHGDARGAGAGRGVRRARARQRAIRPARRP